MRQYIRRLELEQLPALLQPRVEILAIGQLHHHVKVSRVFEARLQADDVFMLELLHDQNLVRQLLVQLLALDL
jgi:hypothetical protein